MNEIPLKWILPYQNRQKFIIYKYIYWFSLCIHSQQPCIRPARRKGLVRTKKGRARFYIPFDIEIKYNLVKWQERWMKFHWSGFYHIKTGRNSYKSCILCGVFWPNILIFALYVIQISASAFKLSFVSSYVWVFTKQMNWIELYKH